jgi:Thiamine pyrophosphate enzyme, C-terminal TPP binding domain
MSIGGAHSAARLKPTVPRALCDGACSRRGDRRYEDRFIRQDRGRNRLYRRHWQGDRPRAWIARNFPTYYPNGCIISNGLAAIGIALPGAIAASLVQPGRAIVAAMGDGGFLMNLDELETAKRLGVGFTVIVFNDNDYGLIS